MNLKKVFEPNYIDLNLKIELNEKVIKKRLKKRLKK